MNNITGDGLDERELGEFSDSLGQRGRVKAPLALRTQLRASLLAAPFVPRAKASLWSRLGALRPALALVVVIALLSAGGGSVAASSLPGEPTFGLKRVIEDAQVTLAPDEAAKLNTLLTQSDRRLADLQTVVAVRAAAVPPATDEYLAAVARVDAALSVALSSSATSARDAAVAHAAASSVEHVATLQALATRLPQAAQRGIQRAVDAQQSVHGKSGNAPGRPIAPGNGNAPGRGGPPSGVPGRP